MDLPMARDRFRPARRWIVLDVVTAPMTKQGASCLFQRPDQVESLHATSKSSTFLMPGIGSVVNV